MSEMPAEEVIENISVAGAHEHPHDHPHDHPDKPISNCYVKKWRCALLS